MNGFFLVGGRGFWKKVLLVKGEEQTPGQSAKRTTNFKKRTLTEMDGGTMTPLKKTAERQKKHTTDKRGRERDLRMWGFVKEIGRNLIHLITGPAQTERSKGGRDKGGRIYWVEAEKRK